MSGEMWNFWGTIIGAIIGAVIGGVASAYIAVFTVKRTQEKELETSTAGILSALRRSCDKIVCMHKEIKNVDMEMLGRGSVSEEVVVQKYKDVIEKYDYRIAPIKNLWEKSSGYVYLLLKREKNGEEMFDAIQQMVHLISTVSDIQANINGRLQNQGDIRRILSGYENLEKIVKNDIKDSSVLDTYFADIKKKM